jgi:hypothetical protein
MRDYTTRFVISLSGLFLLIAALWGGADQPDPEDEDTPAKA